MNISKAASALGKLGAGKRRKQDPVLRRAICDKARQANIERMNSTFVARFWNKVSKRAPTYCWLWLGGINTSGYGQMSWKGILWIASRIAYTLEIGPIPKGICVLHRCDTPRCCNPDHLFLGTHQDNVRDRDFKGRGNAPKEEQHWKAKLTPKDVLEIRKQASQGVPHATIAATFGVAKKYVPLVVSKRRWKHI